MTTGQKVAIGAAVALAGTAIFFLVKPLLGKKKGAASTPAGNNTSTSTGSTSSSTPTGTPAKVVSQPLTTPDEQKAGAKLKSNNSFPIAANSTSWGWPTSFVQAALNLAGESAGDIDGKYGSQTMSALRSFRTKHISLWPELLDTTITAQDFKDLIATAFQSSGLTPNDYTTQLQNLILPNSPANTTFIYAGSYPQAYQYVVDAVNSTKS